MGQEQKKFEEGGLWDEREWVIRFDEEVSLSNSCRHCRENDNPIPEKYAELICPRVVVAYNEGGLATTGVCLDCILEAAANL